MFLLALLWLSTTLLAQSHNVDTLPSGEIILKQEITITAPINSVWKAYTDETTWKKWVIPVVKIDMRINGSILSHYNPNAQIGDSGTIKIHILNYIPQKQITMQAEMDAHFPKYMSAEAKNLYSIVNFDSVDNEKTTVTLYGIGYPNNEKWQPLLKFFIQGNNQTLKNLKAFLEN